MLLLNSPVRRPPPAMVSDGKSKRRGAQLLAGAAMVAPAEMGA